MLTYKDTHELTPSDLRNLFLSVDWSSGHYPEKLAQAMLNFGTVYSVWDEDKLVGLLCALDDGIMTAYVHYLLVDPAYQRQGVGSALVGMMKERYKDYLRIVVVAYDAAAGFYEACGFKKAEDASAMFITSLWT